MNERAPSVAVILPTYNRAANFLDISLASIAAQTRAADEIIVVDDGSSDNTKDVVATYGDRVRYIYQTNQGRAAANNTGIQACRSDYVLLFDDDDALLPEALQLHLDAAAQDARAEYTYSRYFVFDDETGSGDIWQRAKWRRGDVQARPPEEMLVATMEWIGAALRGMLIARACFDKVGLFSTELLRAQDFEFEVRLARACRGRFIDRETFVSRAHEGVRGPARERIKGAQRHALSHRYEQQIFRGVRGQLALAEYLPRDPHAPVPASISAEDRRAALLTRARIMFLRGLFVEGAADIGELLDDPDPSAELIAALDAIVRDATNMGEPDYQNRAAELARALCLACRRRASRPLLRTAARGFYWTARRARRRRNWSALPAIAAAIAAVEARRVTIRS